MGKSKPKKVGARSVLRGLLQRYVAGSGRSCPQAAYTALVNELRTRAPSASASREEVTRHVEADNGQLGDEGLDQGEGDCAAGDPIRALELALRRSPRCRRAK